MPRIPYLYLQSSHSFFIFDHLSAFFTIFLYNYILVFMKNRQCLIPQRQIKWKKYAYLHNKQKKIFYACQCGKKYISFQALYLHFKRKHNLKISNKLREYESEIRNDDEVVHFYFVPSYSHKFFNNENLQSVYKSNRWVFLHDVLVDFLKEGAINEGEWRKKDFILKIIENLQYFINDRSKKIYDFQIEEREILEYLPLQLNEFVMQEVQVGNIMGIQQYQIACNLLVRLSDWLHTKTYSTLRIQLNNIQ